MENQPTDDEIALPGVSILVATLNAESTIDECLRSILELEYPKELFEVIVIDGGSKDATIEHAKNHLVKLISDQMSTPAAYNLALKIIKNEIVGFIDSDAKVEKQWLKKLIGHLSSSKVAGVGGTVETWNNSKLVPRCIGYELTYRYHRLPQEVERITTMNFIAKRKAIEEVGGYDETLITQYDTDLGTRLVKAGYKIIFDPNAVCYHFHRPTLPAFFKQQFKYGENTWRLYFKHPRLARGDRITNWWMNIQPLLYSIAVILLIASIVASVNLVGMMLFLSFALLLTLQYAFSAARISLVFHDSSAMFLIVLYFTRAVAWTLGGVTSFVGNVFKRVRGSK